MINGLTNREKQILILIANGLTNKQIAIRLSISESTVENHTHRVYKKIQVSNRSQATALAFQAGLIKRVDISVRIERNEG